MKSFAIMLGVSVSLAAAAALAGDDRYWEKRAPDPEGADIETLAPAKPKVADRDHTYDRKDIWQADPDRKLIGMSFEGGGGVGGFMDSRIADVTSTQAQWTARMVYGTRSHFAGETAYIGSAQKVNTLGIRPNATITGNGAEAAFRYNALTGMFQPYATGGLGWTHYSLGYEQLTTSDVQLNGDVLTFPIGVGMAWRYNMLLLDSRLSFTPSTNSALIRNTNLSTWNLQAHAGFEF